MAQNLPSLESIAFYTNSQTREFWNEELGVDDFETYVDVVLSCTSCSTLLHGNYLDLCGSSSRDNDVVSCPVCERPIATLKSAGYIQWIKIEKNSSKAD